MIEEINFSKTGLPIATVCGIPIHSVYDPVKEAERFIQSKNLNQDSLIILLIAPGLCYLVPPLRKRIPGVRIIALHCSSFFKNHMDNVHGPDPLGIFKPDAQWSCSDDFSIQTFLENELDDAEARTTKIMEWRPATKAYGAIALNLLDSVAQYLKRANANAVTSETFGKKWLKNAIRLIDSYKPKYRLIKQVSKPIILVASGPSLEDFIQLLDNPAIRKQYVLLAVSSAADSLLARDIIPDLIVATDGGNWAKFHLFEAVRKKIPLAISLVGSLPSQYFDLPLFIISDGSHYQQTLIREIASPLLIAPQRGTVAATAIDLALSWTHEKIYITGLDLGIRNGRSHARPNALDRFYQKSDNRIYPGLTGDYQRYLDNKRMASLDIYAKWFSEKSKIYGKQLVVLGLPNSALSELDSIETLPVSQILDPTNGEQLYSEVPHKFQDGTSYTRKACIANISSLLQLIQLECSVDTLDAKKVREGICGELLPLIDTDLYRLLLIRGRWHQSAGQELVISILDSVRKQFSQSKNCVDDIEAING